MEIMRTESLNCNNCGAPLEVPETAHFAKCNHCTTQLAIHRTDTATYTEKLAEVTQRADRLADEVALLAYRNDLANIDRAWERVRQPLMLTDKHGNKSVPSAEVGLITGGLVVAVGIGVGLIDGSQVGLIVALVAIVFGAITAIVLRHKATNYRHAYQSYQAHRNTLRLEDYESRIKETEASDDFNFPADSELAASRFLRDLEGNHEAPANP